LLPISSTYLRAATITPVDVSCAHHARFHDTVDLPRYSGESISTTAFRGLLSVHSRCGPQDLLASYERRAITVGRRLRTGPDTMMARASTDMGNVSQVIPAIHPYIGIDSLPAVNHQAEFAAATITSAAETAITQGALALAGTVADAASTGGIRQRLLTRAV
jgi:hypothetical protein